MGLEPWQWAAVIVGFIAAFVVTFLTMMARFLRRDMSSGLKGTGTGLRIRSPKQTRGSRQGAR